MVLDFSGVEDKESIPIGFSDRYFRLIAAKNTLSNSVFLSDSKDSERSERGPQPLLFASCIQRLNAYCTQTTKARSRSIRRCSGRSSQTCFPRLGLPIQRPYPPAEAKSVKDVPREPGWLYEPKWDGFRSLAFRSGQTAVFHKYGGIQEISGQILSRAE